jgi:hypothetical protein
MIPNGLFTQIAIVVISVGIIFTYVRPEFAAIGATQEEISAYQEERGKITLVNSQLADLITRMKEVTSEDQRRLNAYIPDYIDTIAVPRDLQFIAEEAGVLFGGALYEGQQDFVSAELTDAELLYFPKAHSFSMNFQSSYGQLKDILRLFETNEYPLEVHDLTVTSIEGGFLEVQVGLITYSYLVAEEEVIN